MPYIAVTLASHQPFTDTQTQYLVQGITDVMEHTLRKKRHLVAVSVKLVDPSQWFIATKPLSESSVFMQVFLTAATNTDTEKAQALAELYALVDNLLGNLDETSYIVINAIPATDWGYAGKTQASRYTTVPHDYYIHQAHQLRNAAINKGLLNLKLKLTELLGSRYKALLVRL